MKVLITGSAGFINGYLVEELLGAGHEVVGLDNFDTGKRNNLEQVRAFVSAAQWARFRFIQGDIADAVTCQAACAGVDFVLHQAALGSVPRASRLAGPL